MRPMSWDFLPEASAARSKGENSDPFQERAQFYWITNMRVLGHRKKNWKGAKKRRIPKIVCHGRYRRCFLRKSDLYLVPDTFSGWYVLPAATSAGAREVWLCSVSEAPDLTTRRSQRTGDDDSSSLTAICFEETTHSTCFKTGLWLGEILSIWSHSLLRPMADRIICPVLSSSIMLQRCV